MNIFERVVKKVDGRVWRYGPFGERERERERESVGFLRLKDMFQVFDQFVILSRSEEKVEAAACLSEG